MKVFRAELSPQVDVAVDVSESMFFHEERAARTLAAISRGDDMLSWVRI